MVLSLILVPIVSFFYQASTVRGKASFDSRKLSTANMSMVLSEQKIIDEQQKLCVARDRKFSSE